MHPIAIPTHQIIITYGLDHDGDPAIHLGGGDTEGDPIPLITALGMLEHAKHQLLYQHEDIE